MITYKIAAHRRGDTFDGLNFQINANGSPKQLHTTGIKIDFRKSAKKGLKVKTIAVGNGITVVSASAGTFKIDSFKVDFEPGIYFYDVEFTDGSVVKTHIEGTWEIVEDVTD